MTGYSGMICSHPHNLPLNDECAVWWLRGTPDWRRAHINLPPAIGDTRACPDCGRPQHYTGIEHGWAHDALIDTWECNAPLGIRSVD